VTLDEDECWVRLAAARHAVMATVHDRRGVDAVPVVFALAGRTLVVPIDSVKAKGPNRLQRLRNLDRDSRCVLLVEHFDDDWSQLWWVRVHATGAEVPITGDHLARLASRYQQYRQPNSVVSAIVLTPSEITGWAAGPVGAM
jgi:PPOX class probable F420-dependent enzyme